VPWDLCPTSIISLRLTTAACWLCWTVIKNTRPKCCRRHNDLHKQSFAINQANFRDISWVNMYSYFFVYYKPWTYICQIIPTAQCAGFSFLFIFWLWNHNYQNPHHILPSNVGCTPVVWISCRFSTIVILKRGNCANHNLSKCFFV